MERDGHAYAEPGAEGETNVRMVVLSDIHATESGDPFTNVAKSTSNDELANSLIGARSKLAGEVERADVLICPGDLVDGGVTDSMGWVWEVLHEIADDLGAHLIGTAGNHDMLLEPTGGDKQEKSLRALRPKFPHDEAQCVSSHWAHQLAVVEADRWRVLSINSSAMLGGYDESEAKHGRFTRDCFEELSQVLENAQSRDVNVCVCHHHPQEWTEDSDRETNHMLEGDRLIELLEDRDERWMLVHGHKHYPRLDYVGRTSTGLVRLASGSVGADLLGESGTQVRNQMHVVEFDGCAADLGLALAGRVTTFEFDPGLGWVDPASTSELPASSVFGYRRDGTELASWLRERAQERGQRSWKWPEVVELEPRCAYLADCDRRRFDAGIRRVGGGVQEDIGEVTFAW